MATTAPPNVRHRIIAVSMLMAFIPYLDRICLSEIVKSASLKTDLPLTFGMGSAPAPGAASRALAVGPARTDKPALASSTAPEVRREGATNNTRGACAPLT